MIPWLTPYLLRINLTKAEGDGATLLISDLLLSRKIAHTVHYGICNYHYKAGCKPKTNLPHFWIDLPTGERIDIRLQMHFGQGSDVSHGIFKPHDYPKVEYVDRGTVEPRLLNETEVQLLMQGDRPPEHRKQFGALRERLFLEWIESCGEVAS